MAKLDESQIQQSMANVPQWTRTGSTIEKTFQLKDFAEAIKFVNAVAQAAEAMDHHPDIDIRWNKVSLRLTTHSAKGLTANDFELARKVDQITG